MLESSNYERGSSWAVEVGGNLKVCSIMVENLNKNGQMVVEVCIYNFCKFYGLLKSTFTIKVILQGGKLLPN